MLWYDLSAEHSRNKSYVKLQPITTWLLDIIPALEVFCMVITSAHYFYHHVSPLFYLIVGSIDFWLCDTE